MSEHDSDTKTQTTEEPATEAATEPTHGGRH